MRINRSVIFNRESQEYIENAFKQGLQEQGLSVRFTGKESVGPNPEDYERHMSLKINGETIWNGTAQSTILSKEHIKITSDIKELQIYFSALNFSANALPRYACKLEGIFIAAVEEADELIHFWETDRE